MLRPTSCRGTTRGRAYILCDPHLRPEQATGFWRMSDGKGGWAMVPSVRVRAESDAAAEDFSAFVARRATAVDLDCRGVSRPLGHINGVYEPTDESCDGWPVYKKRGSNNHFLGRVLLANSNHPLRLTKQLRSSLLFKQITNQSHNTT